MLDILEPRRSQFTGREAHDKVRAILDETLDEALWDAFRLKQGAQLEQAAFAGGSLGRALDKAAGGDATGDREDDLWERITAERDRYWTATGQVKADRSALSSQVSDAASRVADAGDRAPLVGRRCRSSGPPRAMRPRSWRKGRRPSEESEDALVAQFEAIQSRRHDVARLEGLHDTALAQRDHLLGVSSVRAELQAAGGGDRRRSGRDRVTGRRRAARPPGGRGTAAHGAAGVRRRESRDRRGRARPAAGRPTTATSCASRLRWHNSRSAWPG